MEDRDIVVLYEARLEEAIRETANKYGKYCHSVAYGILGSHEDAEECVNDTYIRAWDSIPPQKPSRLSAFLGKITRNLALDRLSAAKAEKRGGNAVRILEELNEAIPSLDSAEALAEERELKSALDRFVKGLPLQTRKLFLGRYWYCRRVSELAARYGISESNVKTTLHRTRKALKVFLEKEGIAL